MKLHCPDCRALILAKSIDLPSQTAKCKACGSVSSLFSCGFPAELGPAPSMAERPEDARATVERRRDEMTVRIAPEGMGTKALFFLAAMVFDLIFAVGVPLAILLLLGPTNLWISVACLTALIPLTMLAFTSTGLLWIARGVTVLQMNQEEVVFERRCMGWRRRRRVPRHAVEQARLRQTPNRFNPSSPDFSVEMPHQGGVVNLPVRGKEECDWLVQELNSFLNKGKPVPARFF